jgi:hypothetical protein
MWLEKLFVFLWTLVVIVLVGLCWAALSILASWRRGSKAELDRRISLGLSRGKRSS